MDPQGEEKYLLSGGGSLERFIHFVPNYGEVISSTEGMEREREKLQNSFAAVGTATLK